MTDRHRHSHPADGDCQSAPPSGRSDRPATGDIKLTRFEISLGDQPLLNPVDLTLPSGAITVIVGPSGAGKSLFLRILAGLISPNDPTIRWKGKIERADGGPLPHVGVVFQDFALFDEWSPLANVQFAIDHRPDRTRPPEQSAEEWLTELQVPKTTAVSAMSGGQRQRLAIARTLAADPEVVLFDEPTSGLDAGNSRRVADLIRRIQRAHGRTSIAVGHDYDTWLPIADHLLLLDPRQQSVAAIDHRQPSEISREMQAMLSGEQPLQSDRTAQAPARGRWSRLGSWILDLFDQTGRAMVAAARLPWDALPRWPHPRWGIRFVTHYLALVAGPSAWLYLLLAGVITGFATTYFIFRYLPFSLYTKPLLIEDLLASIGFALFRVLIPLLGTVLIAARCGAAVAADVGAKKYGSQIDALHTLGVRPRTYLLSPILMAFIVATPVLVWASFQAARSVSLLTFLAMHPDLPPQFWDLHFSSRLYRSGQSLPTGVGWTLLKSIGSGIGIAAIAYYLAMKSKTSTRDVSRAITSTVLWATLFVLLVHAIVAVFEFRVPISAPPP